MKVESGYRNRIFFADLCIVKIRQVSQYKVFGNGISELYLKYPMRHNQETLLCIETIKLRSGSRLASVTGAWFE